MCMCLSDNSLVQDNLVIKFARRRQFRRTNKVLASTINCSCLILFSFFNFFIIVFITFIVFAFYFSLQLLSEVSY